MMETGRKQAPQIWEATEAPQLFFWGTGQQGRANTTRNGKNPKPGGMYVHGFAFAQGSRADY